MEQKIDIVDADVLIIGSGVAGLQAALAVSKSGKKAVLVSKSPIGKANNTTLAGGGFSFATDALSVEAHIEKTLESGRLLNDRKLVKFFATLAPSKFDSRMQLEYFIVNNPGQSKIPRGGENQVFDVGIKDVCL